MSFTQQLDLVAKHVEQRLDDLLPADGDTMSLASAMRYAALGPGKRLRPFLLVHAARLFDAPEAGAIEAAAALECIHCYSLVHDDLPAMDDDKLRRGRPTVHIAFNEAIAILAGDGLLTLAFEILSAPSVHPDPAIRAELTLLLAKASGWHGMVLGQALDLAAEGHGLSEAEIARLQALKTGALFGFACEAGAVLGRADPVEREALKAYASAFGRAFQLADDLLDAEGNEAELGKAAAKDAARGKATLVGLLGIEAAHLRLDALVEQAETALAPFGARAATLKETARFVASRRA